MLPKEYFKLLVEISVTKQLLGVTMKQWMAIISITMLVSISTMAKNSNQTPSRSAVKQSSINLLAYQQEIAGSVEMCRSALTHWQSKSTKKNRNKPIAIFDIDETLLSNQALMEKYNYKLTVDQFHAEVASSHPVAIPKSRELLHAMRKAGLEVVLITGRKQGVCQKTAEQLQANGIDASDYIALYCHNDNKRPADYKAAVRQRLVDSGHTVIFSVSDQMGDLTGEHVGTPCQLPNPFYQVA
jgi:predicted secreted acid phosphatase